MSPLKQDDETARDSINPDFLSDHGISPIGADELAQMQKDAYDGAAEDTAKREGFYNPEDVNSSESAASTDGGDSKGADKEAAQAGGLYNDDSYQPKGFVGKFLGSKKGKWLAGGIGGGIVGASMFGLFLLPLKVMHMADNLQNTFFSSTEKAMEDTTNRLLAGYLIRHVMPGMSGSCQSTLNVDKSCAIVGEDQGIVSVLYRAWRDTNLEGQLAEKYGIEIRREGGRYMMRVGDQTLFSGVTESEIKNERFIEDKMFSQMNRQDVRREFLKAIENETFYKRIMYRYKYGSLMERKYGIVRCLVACEYQNDRAEKKEFRNIKFKAWLAHRVIGPMNQTYALAFECSLGGFNCVSEGSYQTSEDGDRRSQFETDVRAKVGDAIGDGRMTKERLAKVQADIDDIRNGGLSNHLFKKVFGPVATKIAGTAIPGIGLLDTAARIVDGVQSAGPAVKTMNYVMKSQIYVQSYMMYRTNADEIKSGNIDMEELGYVGQSLGDGFGTGQGGGGAESSAYYQDIMGTESSRAASLFPTASAAPYECNDESTIADGLCPEMTMGAATAAGSTVGSVSDVLGSIPGLGAVADAWLATGGKVFDGIGSALGSILGPVFGALTPSILEDKAEEIGKAIAEWFAGKFLVNPLGEDPSGARMFDSAAMGANVAANDYAHYGLGAGEISDADANGIRAERHQEQLDDFAEKSFFAKLFDTSDSSSAVSQLALSLPSDQNIAQSLATSILNPRSFTGMFGASPKADAAAIKSLDLGGVTQYGFREDNPIFKTTDYEKYWADNSCDDESKFTEWAESSELDEDTGMYVNKTPYPCKLLETAAQANCGYLSDECLPAEDLGGSGVGLNGGGANFRAASFNILHYPDGDWVARLGRSVRTIKENNTDIAALQEVRPQQLELLKKDEYLADQYDIWPNATKNPGFEPNIIVWKKDKFEVVTKDFITIKYFGGADEQIPIIKFKDLVTGQEFYFSSTHDPADVHGEVAHLRKQNAETYVSYFNDLEKRDPVPAFIAGDFNSGFKVQPDQPGGNDGNNTVGDKRENLTYCILTRDGPFWNAYDAWKNKTGPCPTSSGTNYIDHIFMSKDVQVSNFFAKPKGHGQNGSDHPTIFADIEIPGIAQGAGTEFNIATYNQPARGNASKAVDKINQHKFDVVGMQETYQQYGYLRTTLGKSGYGVYPDWDKSGRISGRCSSPRAIFYNKAKFKLMKAEVIDIPRKDSDGKCPGNEETTKSGRSNLPIIWLQDVNTGQTIIVMNTHSNAYASGAEKRYKSAQIYVSKIQSLKQENPGIPIFFTGDFNEGTGVRRTGNVTYQEKHQNLLYCMFKENKAMVVAHSRGSQPCRNDNEGPGGVDFIYTTPGVKVLSKGEFIDPSTSDSPHPVLYARVQVPSSVNNPDATDSGGFDWPIAKSDHVALSNCWRKPGHTGIDIPVNSKKVLAAASGEVVQTGGPDGDGGNYIIIKHANGKWTNYQHLSSKKVSKGAQVSKGDVIGISGNTGFSTGPHLHFSVTTQEGLDSRRDVAYSVNPLNFLPKTRSLGGCSR